MELKVSAETVNKRVLMCSIIFTVIFTIVALVMGLITSSQVILFDGIINLVGVTLTYLSVISLKFIKKKDSWNYPFGKDVFEPFIVVVQYFIIIFVCITNIFNAIQVIMEGGREINISSGVMYGIFAAVYSLLIVQVFKFLTKHKTTAIAELEIVQWKFSALRSISVLFGFSVAFFLERTEFAPYLNYLDPVLTTLITLMFLKTAIKATIVCVKEIMAATPSKELRCEITYSVNEADKEYNYLHKVIRLGKVGNQIIFEVDYVIKKDSELDSICAQDKLRSEIIKELSKLPYNKWININFIGDVKLSDHICNSLLEES